MGLPGRVPISLALTISLAVISLASAALAATITGNVQGPDGKPFMGAFVVAENTQNKMTVSVLSNAQGRYHIGNLPAATYTVQISAVGYKGDPRTDVRLSDGQKASFDFALQKAMVRWSDLNTYQGRPRNTTSAIKTRSSRPAFNPATRFKSAWRPTPGTRTAGVSGSNTCAT